MINKKTAPSTCSCSWLPCGESFASHPSSGRQDTDFGWDSCRQRQILFPFQLLTRSFAERSIICQFIYLAVILTHALMWQTFGCDSHWWTISRDSSRYTCRRMRKGVTESFRGHLILGFRDRGLLSPRTQWPGVTESSDTGLTAPAATALESNF